ncbi:MAG: hypothetical protein O6918_10100 [Deltaproteobacteria bacterium]|nr:hypothetical protein [Deltaproteobacteria bacterium]
MQATVFQLDDRINAYIAHRQEQGAANATIKHFEYLINLQKQGKMAAGETMLGKKGFAAIVTAGSFGEIQSIFSRVPMFPFFINCVLADLRGSKSMTAQAPLPPPPQGHYG